MQADLWGWFNRFARQAYQEKHSDKIRLIQCYDMGWESLRAEKHSNARYHFEAGLQLAKDLGLPCFELFFDYWCAETIIFYESDYRTGLDRAVKVGARAHQEQYLNCPVRGRVYYTLMYVYYAMDAIGYEDKIREMITFMTSDIPLDADTAQRMMYTRSSLAYALENYDESKSIIQEYINITLGNPHRQSGGYNMLRMNAHAHGHLEDAVALARTGETFARIARLENSVALSLLWQAVYKQYLGDTDDAHVLYQRGIEHYQRFNLKPLPEYYNAVCQYLEQTGKIADAIDLRQQQLAQISARGSVSFTAYAHLAYARLLGRAGKSTTDAIVRAYEASNALLKPKRFRDKLAQVEAGNYYQFDWQKTW
ncbi:MAG: hypothetical protein AAF846_17200 [Chloroflexota bacterium]